MLKLLGYKVLYINCDLVAIERYKWLFSKIDNKKYKKVLDLGCGNCIVSFAILKKKIADKVFSLSFDKINNQKAQERSKLLKLHDHNIIYSDFNSNINTNGSINFDCAISLETIEHVKNDVVFLNNISKALKEGGELYLSFPNPNFKSIIKSDYILSGKKGAHVRHGYTVSQIKNLLQRSGFRLKAIENLTSNKVFFISQIFRLLKIYKLSLLEKIFRIPALIPFYLLVYRQSKNKGNYYGVQAIKIE